MTLAATSALAEPPPEAVWQAMKERAVIVESDDGTAVAGKLIGVDAAVVVVLTKTGEPVTISRATVRAVRGDTTETAGLAPPGPAAPSALPPSSPASVPAGAVMVHIDSNKPELKLYRITGQATYVIAGRVGAVSAFDVICTAPCDRPVDGSRGEQFFLSADGPRIGPLFHLYDRDKSGKVTLSADIHRSPSAGLLYGGITLASLGGAGVVFGVVFAVLSSALPTTEYDDEGNSITKPNQDGPIYWGVAGGSAAVLGGGILMAVLASGSYDVKVPLDAGLGLRLRGFAFTPPVRLGSETLPAAGSLSFAF